MHRARFIAHFEPCDAQLLRLSLDEFLNLPQYNLSLPSNATPGLRWRLLARRMTGSLADLAAFKFNGHRREAWIVGEYGAFNERQATIAINWYRPIIRVRAGSAPREDTISLLPLPWLEDAGIETGTFDGSHP